MAYRQNSTDLSGILALGSDWNFKDAGYLYGCGSCSTAFPVTIELNWYTDITSPTLLVGATSWKRLSIGHEHGLGIDGNGTVWSWGSNAYGKLGLGGGGAPLGHNYPVPVEVITDMAPCKYVHASGDLDYIGEASSFAISAGSGYLWAWGNNDFGQLGLNDSTWRSIPTQVGSLPWTKVVSVLKHVAGIQVDGKLYTWGIGTDGQLGSGTATNRSSPVRVGSGYWKDIATGDTHTIGIKTDGTLWAWGYNENGQLGVGNVTSRSSPVQIGTDNTWISVSANKWQSFAIKTGGTLWAWGRNAVGQLGVGDTNHRSSPVQVGSDNNWIAVSCGYQHTLALRHNTTTGQDEIYGTGSDNSGALGGIGQKSSMTLITASGNNPDDGIFQITAASDGSLWKTLNSSEY